MIQYSRDSCDVEAVSVPQSRPRVLVMLPGHRHTRVIISSDTDLLRGLWNCLDAISDAGEDGSCVPGAGGHQGGRDVSRGRTEVSAEAGHPGVQAARRVVPAIRQTGEHGGQ